LVFVSSILILYSFFFFQAEDGIRDRNVTGVQSCALPISFDIRFGTLIRVHKFLFYRKIDKKTLFILTDYPGIAQKARTVAVHARSEERRVGKEGRTVSWRYHVTVDGRNTHSATIVVSAYT